MKIVVLEDHLAFRHALRLLLGAEGHEVVEGTASAAEAHALVVRHRPDVLLVDLGLPGEDAVGLIERLSAREPWLRLVVYTGSDDRGHIQAALDAGADGVVSKEAPTEELVAAMDEVRAGRPWLDPRIERLALEAAGRAPVLSPREREVLGLLAAGLNGAQVAEQLVLTQETVRSHVKSAMARLEASTRTQAVVLALQRAEISLR